MFLEQLRHFIALYELQKRTKLPRQGIARHTFYANNTASCRVSISGPGRVRSQGGAVLAMYNCVSPVGVIANVFFKYIFHRIPVTSRICYFMIELIMHMLLKHHILSSFHIMNVN